MNTLKKKLEHKLDVARAYVKDLELMLEQVKTLENATENLLNMDPARSDDNTSKADTSGFERKRYCKNNIKTNTEACIVYDALLRAKEPMSVLALARKYIKHHAESSVITAMQTLYNNGYVLRKNKTPKHKRATYVYVPATDVKFRVKGDYKVRKNKKTK